MTYEIYQIDANGNKVGESETITSDNRAQGAIATFRKHRGLKAAQTRLNIDIVVKHIAN